MSAKRANSNASTRNITSLIFELPPFIAYFEPKKFPSIEHAMAGIPTENSTLSCKRYTTSEAIFEARFAMRAPNEVLASFDAEQKNR